MPVVQRAPVQQQRPEAAQPSAPRPASPPAPSPASPAFGANQQRPSRPAGPAGAPDKPAENPFQRYVPPESREAVAPVRAASEPAPFAPVAPHRADSQPAASVERPAMSSFAGQGLALAQAPSNQLAPEPTRAPEPVRAPESVRPQPAVAPVPVPAPASLPESGADGRTWQAIVERMRKDDGRWSAMYEHGIPSELSATRVVICFPEGSFFGRQAQTQAGTDALRRAAQNVLSGNPEIAIKLASEVRGVTLAQRDAAALDERKEGIKKRALQHPRVLEALKIFPELATKQDIQVD